MFSEEYYKAKDLFGKLEGFEVDLLIVDLLTSEQLNFVTIATRYIGYLRSNKSDNERAISELILHLSVTSANESNMMAKNARKLLYNRGYMKGSPFGDGLDLEFGSASPLPQPPTDKP